MAGVFYSWNPSHNVSLGSGVAQWLGLGYRDNCVIFKERKIGSCFDGRIHWDGLAFSSGWAVKWLCGRWKWRTLKVLSRVNTNALWEFWRWDWTVCMDGEKGVAGESGFAGSLACA